ncbi:MAG: acetate kinase [Betaproteobacteria bacterium HGW-Betaproteobacteria-22]|nr:MAG: acetate kinase [Betaproteobacteria bacterium HGW-Betaproteobacteria-22]
MEKLTILTINSGSSSLKASVFLSDGTRLNFQYPVTGGSSENYRLAFNTLFEALAGINPDVIGHRFVHGGDVSDSARQIDPIERERLDNIVHLAPLHMPANLLGVDLCTGKFKCPQIACFDTAFHATLSEMAYRLPIPQSLKLRRYGFHGINYAHIAQQLPERLGQAANGSVVVAHLGSGASLCLMDNLRSTDTSMGYTPAGGIPMASRSGDLDPGVMLELAKRYSYSELSWMTYHQMGLIALSDEESGDMATLINSQSKAAHFAVDYFCNRVRAEIGAYAAKAGGIDALVFTGGIGEHCARIRTRICQPLAFMGFELNEEANKEHDGYIHSSASKPILIIPADEEAEIARLSALLFGESLH